MFTVIVLVIKMSVLEATLNSIVPLVIRILLLVGISEIIGGGLIGLYQFLKKGEWKKLLLSRILSGTAMTIGGLLVQFLVYYEISYESYSSDSFKMQILVSVLTLLTLWNLFRQDKKLPN